MSDNFFEGISLEESNRMYRKSSPVQFYQTMKIYYIFFMFFPQLIAAYPLQRERDSSGISQRGLHDQSDIYVDI